MTREWHFASFKSILVHLFPNLDTHVSQLYSSQPGGKRIKLEKNTFSPSVQRRFVSYRRHLEGQLCNVTLQKLCDVTKTTANFC